MHFENVKGALSWYILRSDENYSPLGAVMIGDDAGVDISITNDGYDDVDTMVDIEKLLNSRITKLEKDVILHHTKYGFSDTKLNDDGIQRGSYSKYKRKICPQTSVDGKRIRFPFTSESYFRNFIRSIEKALEVALINAGYIMVCDFDEK